MIRKKTVFVLGAGASMPFGFPSGEQLVEDIRVVLSNGLTCGKIESVLKENDEDRPGCIRSFVSALAASGRMSIDAFLEHNHQYLAVGKLSIAAVLCPKEKHEAVFDARPNWYKYLFARLSATFEEFPHNEVAFITFNYDRSLEYFFVTALQNSYPGHTYDECMRCMKKLPIIHIHGQMGNLPDDMSASGTDERLYNGRVGPHDLKVSAKNIRIVHEEVGPSEQLDKARKLLQKAENICILGLGYGEANLDRLGLREMAVNHFLSKSSKRIFRGTALRLGKGEQGWVLSYFCDLIDLYGGNIDGFLKDTSVLWERMDLDDVDMPRLLGRPTGR